MKPSFCICVAIGALMHLTAPATAQSLTEALALTYDTNPTLAADRQNLRSLNEQVPSALAPRRPSVSADASIGAIYQDTDLTDWEFTNPGSVGVSVRQNLYDGGSSAADLLRAEHTISAARASLASVEQQVLLAAVTSYMDVLQLEAVLELQISNENVLERQLQATLDRFEVGEVTRTDVSQAESRLSGARADRLQAAGNLRAARAAYEEVVGEAPGTLSFPTLEPDLPTSLDEAIDMAESRNPGLIAAIYTELAALASIELAAGNLYPEINATGRFEWNYEPSTTVEQSTSASVIVELVIPIYQQGLVASNVREARYLAQEAQIDVETARRDAVQTVISAWEELLTTRATIDAVNDQVIAATIALDGVQQEATVGSRTVLDVLDAEQELLDARVALVQAQRNEVVAQYTLLSAVGRLTATGLDLPVVVYDPDTAYELTRSRLFGTDIVAE